MYGHVMVIAGSRGKSGAVLLSSRGALRAGAGLVTAAIPASVADIVASQQAELMTEPIADRDGQFDGARATQTLSKLIEPMTSLVVGPGIGVSDCTRELIEWVISEAAASNRPVLIDADGLNAIAQLGAERLKNARGPIVLTPHPGEMSRLLKTDTRAVNADRIGAARRLSDLTGAVVLLKGSRSVITGPSGEVFINSTGNPGMSTPGMGDALSGIVGALMGQNLEPIRALAFGCFIHGYAADRVAERYGHVGYIVGDLIDELPRAIDSLIYRRAEL
jgi:ADP-dependent NAD(P)H-hydrate dehydratase / NAD(P)H-hydrate epimerase